MGQHTGLTVHHHAFPATADPMQPSRAGCNAVLWQQRTLQPQDSDCNLEELECTMQHFCTGCCKPTCSVKPLLAT